MDGQFQHVPTEELRVRSHLESTWFRALVPELERIDAACAQPRSRVALVGDEDREEEGTDAVSNARKALNVLAIQQCRQPPVVPGTAGADVGIVESRQQTLGETRPRQGHLLQVD